MHIMNFHMISLFQRFAFNWQVLLRMHFYILQVFLGLRGSGGSGEGLHQEPGGHHPNSCGADEPGQRRRRQGQGWTRQGWAWAWRTWARSRRRQTGCKRPARRGLLIFTKAFLMSDMYQLIYYLQRANCMILRLY